MINQVLLRGIRWTKNKYEKWVGNKVQQSQGHGELLVFDTFPQWAFFFVYYLVDFEIENYTISRISLYIFFLLLLTIQNSWLFFSNPSSKTLHLFFGMQQIFFVLLSIITRLLLSSLSLLYYCYIIMLLLLLLSYLSLYVVFFSLSSFKYSMYFLTILICLTIIHLYA